MPSGRPASGRNAAKSVASSVARSAVDHRQPLMAVGRRAAVAGQVLEHRQHAALQETVRNRSGNGRDLRGRVAIGAVADHRVGTRDRHIGERQAIHVDAERAADRCAISRAPSRAAARPVARSRS